MIVRAPTRRAAGDRRVPDAAAPEDGDGVVPLHGTRVHRGAEAGHDAAAEQARGLGSACVSTVVAWPAATIVWSVNVPIPSAGDRGVPSSSVIAWRALWVASSTRDGRAGTPGTRRTRRAS